MMLKRVPTNGDTVVIYYPTAGKVMTGTDYVYNSKHELTTVDATLTDDVLAVPSDALRLTVITTVADDGETTLYTFATADGRYLYADASHVQLVDEQGANTLFQLETAAAGTDNYYIKCDSANYNGKAQYLRYINGYISVYSIYANTGINTFQFFSEDGEGPTPEVTYIVTLDPGEAGGEQVTIEDATSPYTLPDCPFTAPEGYVFDGWQADNGDVYAAGTEVVLEEQNTAFTATWKELVARTYELVTSEDGLVDGGTYLIASELFADELYLMSKQTTNNRAQYKVTGVEGTTLTLDESWIATNATDALAFEFTLSGDSSGWSFHDAVTGGFLYAAGNETNEKNWLRTETELDDNGKFVIAYEGDDGATVPVAQGENTRGYMHYNATSDIFSCYAKTSTVKGAVYLYKLVEDAPAAAPSFKTQSLILSGEIGLSFNMELPDIEGVDWTESYMTFTIPHGPCTERADYADSSAKKSGKRGFICYVNAIQMAEPITATFHWTEGEEEKTIEKTYAIKDYFLTYDANKSQFNEKTQKLIEATADYGHYTQAFLAAANGWTLGTDYVEMDKFYATAYNYSDTEAGLEGYTIECNKGDEIRKIGAATVLDSETAIRITLTPISGYTGTITATADGGKDATVTPSGSRYIVVIPNIAAHELTNTYTVTITTANSTATVTLSALSYVKLLFNGNTEAPARNAASAILSYAMAAYAYNNH